MVEPHRKGSRVRLCQLGRFVCRRSKWSSLINMWSLASKQSRDMTAQRVAPRSCFLHRLDVEDCEVPSQKTCACRVEFRRRNALRPDARFAPTFSSLLITAASLERGLDHCLSVPEHCSRPVLHDECHHGGLGWRCSDRSRCTSYCYGLPGLHRVLALRHPAVSHSHPWTRRDLSNQFPPSTRAHETVWLTALAPARCKTRSVAVACADLHQY